MYLKRVATSSAIAALMAFSNAPANASDLPDSGDPHVDQQLRQELRWSGLYVGFGAQAGTTNHDTSFEEHDPDEEGGTFVDDAAFIDGISSQGVGLSGTVGYDQRLPGTRFVIGVFGNYVYSEDYWETEFGASDEGERWLSGELSKDNEWTLGGRAGALVTPSTMLYALAGYTEADFSGAADVAWSDSSVSFGDQTFSGYTGGLGIEVKNTDFMSFVIEGRYTQYDSETLFDGRDEHGEGLFVDAEPSEIKILGELRFKLLTE